MCYNIYIKKKGVVISMMYDYEADYEDDNFEIIYAYNDNEAIEEAKKYESEHGMIVNLYEVDENYERVRMIL